MDWCALLPTDPLSDAQRPVGVRFGSQAANAGSHVGPGSVQALACWALGFTPRVARLDEAVVMDVAASLRLWGGRSVLRERVRAEAAELGCTRLAWASNPLAALALARGVQGEGVDEASLLPLSTRLDPLPLTVLSATEPHRPMLARLGCQTLGALRRLPRAGLVRRFGSALLHALDRLYGQAPQPLEWVVVPECFEARLELPHRVDSASGLMWGAHRLLLQLGGWLVARQAGVTALTLHWAHDAMRSRGAGEGGRWTVHTAEPTREVAHLSRLLAEHLARLSLAAPVGDLRLTADEVRPLAGRSASWLPDDPQTGGEALLQVLERVSVRLGPQRVVRPVLVADHRPEHMSQWVPAMEGVRGPSRSSGMSLSADTWGAGAALLAQPSFLLPQPLKLCVRQHRPLYQGELQLWLGPHRIEGGWWDRDEATGQTRHAVRDYWVARSPVAGVLWVFQTRLDDEPAWFLHGFFA